MNHFSRLLRLSRRTGDRLIVTDEQGGGEPLVILPLDEYEALVDGALGPDAEGEELAPWDTDEDAEEEIESIQLPDEGILEEVLGSGGEGTEEGPEEADINEEALKELWKSPESSKSPEKAKEVPKKPQLKNGGDEERFYLEPLD